MDGSHSSEARFDGWISPVWGPCKSLLCNALGPRARRVSRTQLGVRRRIWGLLALLALCAWPSTGFAQGWVWVEPDPIPQHRRIPPRRPAPLPLKNADVKVEIVDGIATVRIDATFYNPHDRALEGTYYLPLPPQAQLDDFRATLGDQLLHGEVYPREKATEIYERLVRRTVDPALLEYFGSGLFRARVFPVPPKGASHLSIRYRHILRRSGELTRFRLPVNAPTREASASPPPPPSTPRPPRRSSAPPPPPASPYRVPASIGIEVDVRSSTRLHSVTSPTHPKAAVTRDGDHRATIRVPAAPPRTREFVLDLIGGSDTLAGGILAFRDPGDDGYFVLRLAPPLRPPSKRAPMHLVLLVDTSGSMSSNDKIGQARRSLLQVLDRLTPEDTFQLVAFSGRVRPLFEAARPASGEHLTEARAFVNSLVATGGTNLEGGLRAALQHARKDDRSTVLVLTDGAPTVGITQPKELLASVSRDNAGDFRIHTFGLGHDVNAPLLDDLARKNRGSRTYIDPDQAIEPVVSSLVDKVLYPCLSNLKLDANGVTITQLEPTGTQDLFYGEDLVIAGRYQGHGGGSIAVNGRDGATERSFVFTAEFPARGGDEEAPYVWAQFRVFRLLDELRTAPIADRARVRKEIVDLGLRYGIVTPYTSFLVQEDSNRVVARGMSERLRRAPGAARRVAEEKQGFTRNQGRSAYELSKKQADRQSRLGRGETALDEEDADLADTLGVEQRGGKAFVPGEAGRRVDGAFSGGELPTPDVILVVGSDEYFAFVRKHPQAASILAGGSSLLFAWEGQVIRVDPGNPEDPEPEAPPKPTSREKGERETL